MAERYNAAVAFVDRNVTEGRAEKVAFRDPRRSLTYGELHDQAQPRRPGARRARRRARASRRDADARHGRFPGRVLGRDPGRDRPGAAQHASGGRPVRLRARGLPRTARRGLGAAAAGRRSRDRRRGAPRENRRRGSGAGHDAHAARGSPDGGCTGRRACRDLRRRGRLLALLVGLDRHAEGRQARPFEPDRDRAALRRGRARHAPRTTSSTRPRSSSSPTASATP